MMPEADVDMRTWFVTGASRGIGAAIAGRALAQGAQVALSLRDVGDAPSGIAEYGDRACLVHCDFACETTLKAAVHDIAQWTPSIDVTILNVGRGLHGAIEEVSNRELREVFEVNFLATLSLVRLLLPLMRAQRSGMIVIVSSIASLTAGPGSGAYAATNAALDATAQALHAEVAPLGIKVCLVRPGPFRTGFSGSSATRSRRQIAGYEASVGRRIEAMRRGSGTEPGDPDHAEAAIVDIAVQPDPPREVFLGSGATDHARKRCTELLRVLETCKTIARATDLPRTIRGDETALTTRSGGF